MKKNSIIYILVACLSFSVVSCDDMLSPDSERHSYEVGQDTLYSYWGILRSLQNVAERYVVLGECRGELISGTSYLSDSIQAILNFDMEKATDGSCRYLRASDYYHIINSCNAYLASYDSTRVTGTLQPYMKKEAAQVQAIRAWVYLQLIQVYGEVPFYTEPLLTTDNINSFMANKEHQMANADNLADLLVDELESAAQIEMTYGYPQYQSYGYSSVVCHSTKCMIPVNIILGDLYLTKGDKASCEKAAQYYHNYLSANQGMSELVAGGALPNGYYCYGYKGETDMETEYRFGSGIPWTEKGAQSRTSESITAIPSSTNKLWGTVLRGVNELYGYDAEIRVRTSEEDTTTSASILLIPQYDKKQLVASTSYFDLCKEQEFQEYIGADLNSATVQIDPNVGDARQYWVQDVYQTYSNGVTNTEKFITKQNPGGVFTTVFPMIYRKSQIWLRYAEALCGAGYPSYAFAILKDGLCNNTKWLPVANTSDYAVKEWEYSYTTDTDTLTSTVSKAELIETVMEGLTDITAEQYDSAYAAIEDAIDSTAISYQNWPSETTNAVLDYIDMRESQKGGSFLNFNYTTFRGNYSTQLVLIRSSMADSHVSFTTDTYDSDEPTTNGIHSRGCGYLAYKDRHASAYNYVDMVAKKAQENYGVTLTKEDIYSGDYDDIVQKCVEDLIVDEEGLELAFEGTRFFDLMRVAHRRGDATYLAKRLAKRNSALEGKLSNQSNWYFPLPTK